MALFTKLRERVTGVGPRFDSLENIAKKEEDDALESEIDNAFLARHNKSISFFSKEKTMKFTDDKSSNRLSRGIDKFVNVFPTDNNENIYPTQMVRPMETGGGLEKKPSFLALNKQLQKDEVVPQMTPRVELRTESGSSQDNRFATSRSVSFRGMAAAPALALPTAASVPLGSMKSESKEEDYEEAHEYSDEDVDEQGLSQQDRIEMVFSKARHNHIDEVLTAIQNGFNVNTRDVYGNTIIHVCAQNNRKKLAATLLQKYPQCNVHAENFKHFTPVDYAEKYGFSGLASWLREAVAQNESQAARNVSKFR